MQSEYPLSVLIVVPPWPGPVEQNPEPTTPTGPPRPAAAAAATLSRYQGYIERPAEYRRVPSQSSFFRNFAPRTSYGVPNIHSRSHVTFLYSLFLFLSLFLRSVYFFAMRTRHAARDVHLTADGITAPRTARCLVAVHAALAHNDNDAPRSSRARTFRKVGTRRSRGERSLIFAYVSRTCVSRDRAQPTARLTPRAEVACRVYLLGTESVLAARSSTSERRHFRHRRRRRRRR